MTTEYERLNNALLQATGGAQLGWPLADAITKMLVSQVADARAESQRQTDSLEQALHTECGARFGAEAEVSALRARLAADDARHEKQLFEQIHERALAEALLMEYEGRIERLEREAKDLCMAQHELMTRLDASRAQLATERAAVRAAEKEAQDADCCCREFDALQAQHSRLRAAAERYVLAVVPETSSSGDDRLQLFADLAGAAAAAAAAAAAVAAAAEAGRVSR